MARFPTKPPTSLSIFGFASRRRHTSSLRDWSSDVCSSDLTAAPATMAPRRSALSGNATHNTADRSEERHVGKECRSRWSPYHEKKKKPQLHQPRAPDHAAGYGRHEAANGADR